MGVCPPWNLMVIRWLFAWGMSYIYGEFEFNAIPLLIYDVMYINTTP